jgi:Transposase DDE domain
MRPSHSRITSALVTSALCELVVSRLALTDYKSRLPATLLARALLLASVLCRSLSFVAQRCLDGPSDELFRLALLHNLPGLDLLRQRLLVALHSLLPKRVLRQTVPAALDYHQRPFYGDKDTSGIRGGKPETGTRYFWTYATLCLISHGQRYVLGLTEVHKGETQEQVVRRLLEQAGRLGARLRYLLMDRAFHDAAVLALLQERGIPFVVPMSRRGQENGQTGTARFFKPCQLSWWSNHSWVARVMRWDEAKQKEVRSRGVRVSVGVCVVAQGSKTPAVYLTWRIKWPPLLVRKRYRARFGIETSYRQLGEVLAATTSKDERVRLLLVGLALLVRQLWCLEMAQAGLTDVSRAAALRLAELRTWMILELATELRFRLECSPHPQIDQPFTAA